MFEKSGQTSKPMAPERITKIFDENLEWLERMNVIDERFLLRRIENDREFQQRYVFQYVLQTLFETYDDDDYDDYEVYFDPEDVELSISNEEKGYIFILLKTVIDMFVSNETKKKSRHMKN